MTYLLHYSFSAGSILKFWKLGTTVYFSSLTVNSHFFKVAFYHGGEVWVLLDWSQELSSQRPSVHDAFPKINAVAGERPHTPTRWTTGNLLLRPRNAQLSKKPHGAAFLWVHHLQDELFGSGEFWTGRRLNLVIQFPATKTYFIDIAGGKRKQESEVKAVSLLVSLRLLSLPKASAQTAC